MDGRRNWDWHNVVDISPFLRYESTGDSDQLDTDLNMDHAEVKNYEVDDALSCCSDSYDNTAFNKINHGDHEEERAQRSTNKSLKKEKSCYSTCLKKKSKKKEPDLGLGYDPNCRNCNDDGDEDGGSINQVWSSCGNIGCVASSQQKKRSSKSDAFDGSSMDEPKVENDKLFWDTCLDN